MDCHRRKLASPAWGILYVVVAAGLGVLALGETFASEAGLRLIVDSTGLLFLFGGMRIWVGANRAMLALDSATRCCTSRLTIRVIEPAVVTEDRADELELISLPSPRKGASRVLTAAGRGRKTEGDP